MFRGCETLLIPLEMQRGNVWRQDRLLEGLLGICFAFSISTRAGIKLGFIIGKRNVAEETAFVFFSARNDVTDDAAK